MAISRSKSYVGAGVLDTPWLLIELHICPYLNRMHLYKQYHDQFSKPGIYHIKPRNHVRLLGIKYCTIYKRFKRFS
jgi:hypothetical protein